MTPSGFRTPIIFLSELLQALDDAKIQWREKDGHGLDLARCGILIGTAMGGMQTFATACEDLHFKVTLIMTQKSTQS